MKHRSLAAVLWLAVSAAAQGQNAAEEGASLYAHKCAICHAPGGTGAMMLGLRLGKERAILAERTDLTADYVRVIVRSGLSSMPPFTRVEVTDPELAGIAAYLSRNTGKGAP